MSPCAHALLVVLLGIVLRCMVSLHPHSGQGKPPMFGDYEAQRHWMEITYHLPVSQWYFNGTDNDLMYWGLDYPPLTAYHSWLLGFISNKLNASWVELNQSRGFESYEHKVFMRNSVLAADVLTYIPAVIVYFVSCGHHSAEMSSRNLAAALLTLAYPGLLLIDYGHFQFNCISLGLTLWAVVGLCRGHDLLGSVAFVLALNYKQMSLYHALPFFTYLLGSCFRKRGLFSGLWKLMKLAVIVSLAFFICWLPFLYRRDAIFQVLHRVFPFARGLFEDKVANLWCSISVVIKLKQIFDQLTLVRLCLLSTLIAALPSSLHLLLKPSLPRFKYALINSSLVFFLFSFQVHEKSILLAALPVCLQLSSHPLLSVWFLMISTFSMLPLLIKDGLLTAYFASMVVFYLLADICLLNSISSAAQLDKSPNASSKILQTRPLFVDRLETSKVVRLMFWLSVTGMVLLTLSSLFVNPPQRLPDLHPVLVSVYSCAHFIAFLVVFHWLQFSTSDFGSAAGKQSAGSPSTGSHKLKAN